MAWRSRTRPRQRGWSLRTKQPHHVTFIVAFCLATLGLLGSQINIDYVSANALWFVLAAYALLALANLIDGL